MVKLLMLVFLLAQNFEHLTFDQMDQIRLFLDEKTSEKNINIICQDFVDRELTYLNNKYDFAIEIELLFYYKGIYHTYHSCDGYFQLNFEATEYHKNLIKEERKCISQKVWNPKGKYSSRVKFKQDYKGLKLFHIINYLK